MMISTKSLQNLARILCFLIFSLVGISSSQADIVTTKVFLINDALGTPVVKTDQHGRVIWRQYNKPYGDPLLAKNRDGVTDESTGDHSVQYTGHIRDHNLGLVYMQARYYDPQASGTILSC